MSAKNKNIEPFNGFPLQTVTFIQGLSENNKKEWFEEHRSDYENYFLKPAMSFIQDLGTELAKLVKDLQFEPKVNKSIFRLNRDARFSKDKSPYKSHMGILFWKGPYTERTVNPGFYFHMEPYQLFLATGTWGFTPEVLEEYRKSLLNPLHANKLVKISAKLEKNHIKISGYNSLKKYPKGFDSSMPAAEFSKYKGIAADMEEVGSLPDIIHRRELIDYCLAFYSQTTDLMEWMSDMAYRSYSGN